MCIVGTDQLPGALPHACAIWHRTGYRAICGPTLEATRENTLSLARCPVREVLDTAPATGMPASR